MNREKNYELFTYNSNSNQNRTLIPNNRSQNSVTCWNCSFFFKCDDSQPVTLCPNCNKYNRVPKGPTISINEDNTYKIYNNDNNNNNFSNNNNNFSNNNNHFSNNNNNINYNNINFSDKILICPFCYTKNLFERNADELICYKCSRKIKSDENEMQEIFTEKESLDKKIIGWRLVPNAQYMEHPVTPIPQSSNTEYLLKKILKSIKKQNSLKELNQPPTPVYNPYIPYPVFDYRRSINISSDYDDRYVGGRTREIRYVPIRTEPEKESKDGYKITIRKKKGNKNSLAKSTVFEKIFYINK